MGVESHAGDSRRRPSWPVLLLVAVVLLGQVLSFASPHYRPYILGLSVLILDPMGVVASLRAARRGDSTAWTLAGAGRLFSLLTTIALGASAATGNHAWWWTGTLARLLMFAALSAAVVLAPARRLNGRQRLAFIAEAVTVLGGGFMVVWYFAINPYVESGPLSWLALSRIGFPIGDLLLLIAVSLVLLRGAVARVTSPMAVFVAGMTCYLVGDTMWSSIGVTGRHAQNSPLAGLFLVSASLLMTVAPMLVRSGSTAAAVDWQRQRNPVWSVHLPLLALGVGCSLMMVVTVREHDMLPWGGLVIGLIVMTSAVAGRQVISLRESRDLIVSDALTGLANRTGLDNAINRSVRRRDRLAIMLIDLDGFKLINDAYGHAAGDTVLVEFAHHLRSTVRTSDVATRIGGDEFAVLLTDVETAEQATAAAQRVLAAAAANPVRLGEDTVPLRASIGLALGDPADSTKELLRRADVAMYQSKRAGTHGWTLHDPSMTDRRAEDAALGDDLAGALDRGELHVLYQPIVDLTDGHPIAAEALVRWQHPVRGPVSPVQFIPIAERTGVINAIGLWVLEQACLQVARWRLRIPAGQALHMSVNVSPRQLQEPAIVHDILAVLTRTGVRPEHVVLEVTESAIVDQSAITTLRALRSHGLRIAIDDFGTGYSSLHYLTRLPVDILKIDRSFVGELNGTPEGSAITEAVIRLSQVLHLTTVAEGIETADQATELLLLGCDTGQGYLFARPGEAAGLDEMMTALRTNT